MELVLARQGRAWSWMCSGSLRHEGSVLTTRSLPSSPFTEVHGVEFLAEEPVAHGFLHLLMSLPEEKLILSRRPTREGQSTGSVTTQAAWRPLLDSCGRRVGFYSISVLAEMLDKLVQCVGPPSHLLDFDLWRRTALALACA